jgi:pyridoxal phosphate enzyme (YggS family)
MTIFPASYAEEELFERVRANLELVRTRIASSARDPSNVRIVAVTKGFGVSEVRAALALGLTTFGENYVDELSSKVTATRDYPISWHFLGTLQSNKIARVARCANVLSGVAREKEVTRLASASPGHLIDVQVDFSTQASRNGVAPDEVAHLVAYARSHGLSVRGLMVVAPRAANADTAFSTTVDLADRLGLVERSMGMSADLEGACALGSTEVRLGTALFGPRVYPGSLA